MMASKEILESIDYLRERANVSYEEAERLLNQYDGDIMRALIYLEHQGKVYGQEQPREDEAVHGHGQEESPIDIGMKKVSSFVEHAMDTHLVVEQKKDDQQKKVLDVPVPLAIIAAVAAPWLTVAAAGLGWATGHNARIVKEKKAEKTEGNGKS